jgi:flavin-binding protein dodecin
VQRARNVVQPARNVVQRARKVVQPARNVVQRARNAVQPARNAVQRARNSVQRARNSVQRARNSVQRARNSVQRARNAVQRARNSVQRARNAVQPAKSGRVAQAACRRRSRQFATGIARCFSGVTDLYHTGPIQNIVEEADEFRRSTLVSVCRKRDERDQLHRFHDGETQTDG